MKVSELNYNNLTIDIVDKVLFEGIDDPGISGDCIMVLGSIKVLKYRIPKALDVYNTGRCNKILVSGGNKHNIDNKLLCEATIMREKLLEMGIPDDNILVEDTSNTTKENVICSLLTLDRAIGLNKTHRILLVTARYHMRRSILMAGAYMPQWIEIIPCPADDVNTRRHNWFLTERGYKRAVEEAYKIINYIREGSIKDFEI